MSENNETQIDRTPEEVTDDFIGFTKSLAEGGIASAVGFSLGIGIFKAMGIEYSDAVFTATAAGSVGGGMVMGVRGYYKDLLKKFQDKNKTE